LITAPFRRHRPHPHPIALVAAVVAAAGLAAPATALVIDSESAARHDRFGVGTAPNPTFFAGAYDWSGVAVGAKGATMISPQHFVAANHFKPDSPLPLVGTDGVQRTYAIDHYDTLSTGAATADLVLGTLAAPIPDGDPITFYPVIDAPDAWFIGREIVVFGRTEGEVAGGEAGRNRIDDILTVAETEGVNDTIVFAYDYDPANGFSPDEAGGQSGDSGTASFLIYDGAPTVLGPHFAIDEEDPWSTYDSAAVAYLDQLNTLMAAEGYSVTVISVPEPASAVLVMAGAVALGLRRRQRAA